MSLRSFLLFLVLCVTVALVSANVNPTSVIFSGGTGTAYFVIDYAGRVFVDTYLDGVFQLDPTTLTINPALPHYYWQANDTPYYYGFIVDPHNNLYLHNGNFFIVYNSTLNITGTFTLPFATVEHTEIDASGNFIFSSSMTNSATQVTTFYLIKCNQNGALIANYTFNSAVADIGPHTLDANGNVFVSVTTFDSTTYLPTEYIYRLTNNLTQSTLLTTFIPGNSYAEIIGEIYFWMSVDSINSILYIAFSSNDLTQGWLRAYNSTNGTFIRTISSQPNVYQVRVDPTTSNIIASYGSAASNFVRYNRSGNVLVTSSLYDGYSALALDSNNVLYASDSNNGNVVKLSSSYGVAQTYTPPRPIFDLGSFYIGPNNNIYMLDVTGQVIYQVTNSNGASVANYTICYTCVFLNGPLVDSKGNVYASYQDDETGTKTVQKWYNNGTVAGVITAIDFSNADSIALDKSDRLYIANSLYNSTDGNYDQFFLQIVNITTLQTISNTQLNLPVNADINEMYITQNTIYLGMAYVNNYVNVIALSLQTFNITQIYNIPTVQAEWSFNGLVADNNGNLYVSYGTSVYFYSGANSVSSSSGVFSGSSVVAFNRSSSSSASISSVSSISSISSSVSSASLSSSISSASSISSISSSTFTGNTNQNASSSTAPGSTNDGTRNHSPLSVIVSVLVVTLLLVMTTFTY